MKPQEIRSLREELGLSQTEFAEILGVSKRSIVNYEQGSTEPRGKVRLAMASLKAKKLLATQNGQDFKPYPPEGETKVRFSHMKEPDAQWYGDPNYKMVPMVSHRAQAGFLAGWGDPEYVDELPKVPWEVDREYKGHYVCFEVNGDSMDDNTPNALLEGDVILCREVQRQHWTNKLHINQWDFVLVHRERGIVVKRITKHDTSNGELILHSLNEMYEDYSININDCIAIFNVVDVKRSRRR